MDLLSLNDDILSLIAALLSSRDALSLSRTSRKVHVMAKRHALSTVELTSSGQLAAFCTYMLCDVSTHLLCLRSLKVTLSAVGVEDEGMIDYASFNSASLLAALIGQASRLRCLSISCLDELIKTEPHIGAAVASLPNLEKLELHEVGARALDVVRRLRSRPRVLSLHYYGSKINSNPISYTLRNLQNLQIVRLSGIVWPEEDSAPVWTKPWLGVRELQVMYSEAPMTEFVRAFPNVRKLSIRGLYRIYDHVQEPLCWHSLDFIHIYQYDDLARWKITCPVFWLRYEQFGTYPQQIRNIVNAVRDMTPRILSLTVCPISKIEFWTGLADVASRLRYLDLRLGNLSRRSNSSYLAEWLDSMPPVLELNIICIRVGVDSRMVHRPLTPGHTTTQRPPLRLATSIPSLRYIALDHDIVSSGTTALPMVENASWYRAWGPAEERQVHTIPSHVGVRVHGYLHADDMESLEKLEELFSPSEVARKD